MRIVNAGIFLYKLFSLSLSLTFPRWDAMSEQRSVVIINHLPLAIYAMRGSVTSIHTSVVLLLDRFLSVICEVVDIFRSFSFGCLVLHLSIIHFWRSLRSGVPICKIFISFNKCTRKVGAEIQFIIGDASTNFKPNCKRSTQTTATKFIQVLGKTWNSKRN